MMSPTIGKNCCIDWVSKSDILRRKHLWVAVDGVELVLCLLQPGRDDAWGRSNNQETGKETKVGKSSTGALPREARGELHSDYMYRYGGQVFFVPVNIIFWWTFKSLEPFLFGDWTRFPGGKGPYCNASCGSHRYYLKQRSCTPTRIDLPQGYSCESLDDSLTWASSSTPCEPFVPCKGKAGTVWYKVFMKSSWR